MSLHRFCRQSFFQWKPTVFVAYLLCAKNWVRPQGYSNERGGWSFCPHGAEQIYGNETNNCNKQFLETRDPLRLCSSRRSPSCDECMHVACEPLETWAGLWILTLPSAFQPNFLLSCARPFTVQELVRLATGLFLTSSFAHFVPAPSSAFLHRSLYNGFQKALPGKTLPHPPCPN